MSARVFLDTNVLVYLFDRDAPEKQTRARELLENHGGAGTAIISTQVLQEFYVSVTRKLGHPLGADTAEKAAQDLTALPIVQVDVTMILSAMGSSRRHRISFWDALIIDAAMAAGCERVLSEDLAHHQSFGELRVENPFLLSV